MGTSWNSMVTAVSMESLSHILAPLCAIISFKTLSNGAFFNFTDSRPRLNIMSGLVSPCLVVAQCVWHWLPGEKAKHIAIMVKINIRGHCFIVFVVRKEELEQLSLDNIYEHLFPFFHKFMSFT